MATITFVLADNCGFSGISGMIESFTIANNLYNSGQNNSTVPLFEMNIVTKDGRPVRPFGGFKVTPDGSFADFDKSDVVVVPSFLPDIESYCAKMKDTVAWVRERYLQGSAVAALCTGAFLLAETGLLDGRLATTNWYFTNRFQHRYPKVRLDSRRILTEDNGLYCSGAMSAFYNLCLYFIALFGSPDLSATCAKILLVEPSRTNQALYAFFNGYKSHGDVEISRVQEYMENHLSEPFLIKQLAVQTGISSRHFIRRFKNATGESPLNYLQQLRIESAKRQLETTLETIDQITISIGYENSATFRKLFKKIIGLSPTEYRNKFTQNFITPNTYTK